MKMNQIIRQKRIEKGLTQEQVALCLGAHRSRCKQMGAGRILPGYYAAAAAGSAVGYRPEHADVFSR